MEIAGKVVLITGASSGIGEASARLFAQKGAKLALAARSTETLARLASELPDAIAVPTDLRDEAAVRHMVAQTLEYYKRMCKRQGDSEPSADGKVSHLLLWHSSSQSLWTLLL